MWHLASNWYQPIFRGRPYAITLLRFCYPGDRRIPSNHQLLPHRKIHHSARTGSWCVQCIGLLHGPHLCGLLDNVVEYDPLLRNCLPHHRIPTYVFISAIHNHHFVINPLPLCPLALACPVASFVVIIATILISLACSRIPTHSYLLGHSHPSSPSFHFTHPPKPSASPLSTHLPSSWRPEVLHLLDVHDDGHQCSPLPGYHGLLSVCLSRAFHRYPLPRS